MLKKLTAMRDKYFPALGHRDYRLFWTGQCISLIGTWMQTVGQAWLVYQLTDSSFLLGLIGTLQFLPMMLFCLPIGAIIDRHSKKKILFWVQFVMMINAMVLAFMVWTGKATYGSIAVQAFILGVMNSIDMPVRQSFMAELASKQHLMNAIALNSTIFNAARVIGPAVAGLVFSYFGSTICFLLNGISFVPVLLNISRIGCEGRPIEGKNKGRILTEVFEGLVYIVKNPTISTTMMLVALCNTLVMNFNVMVPVMAKTVLQGDSKSYGFLMTALGLGAFTGALSLAVNSHRGLRTRLLMGAYLALSVFIFILGFQSQYIFAFIFFICAGWCMTTALSCSNTSIQTNTPDNMRGRIMSVYSLVLGGSVPIGSMYAGIMCESFGVSTTFKVSGVLGIILVLAIIFSRYELIKNHQASIKAEQGV